MSHVGRYDAARRPLSAHFVPAEDAPFKEARGRTYAQRRGLVYQNKILLKLFKLYGPQLIPQPWFAYKEIDFVIRHAQPDALLINLTEGLIYILEIKTSHTPTAFRQLSNLYLPVVKCWVGLGGSQPITSTSGDYQGLEQIDPSRSVRPWCIICVEITQHFDMAKHFGKEPLFIKDLNEAREDELNILRIRVN